MGEVLIPFGVGDFVALSQEQLEEARQRARDILDPYPIGPARPERIEDAKGMEARTGVPASWWLEQARSDAIPHLRLGKYVRFEFETVLERLRCDPRHAARISAIPRRIAAKSGDA